MFIMENNEHQILVNAIKTPDGTILRSNSHYDYNVHIDKITNKSYAVDGGFSYLRRSCEVNDYTELSLTTENKIEEIRELFQWGTYGKSGNEPLKYILLKDMEDAHIENILDNLPRLPQYLKDLFQRELTYRTNIKFKSI